MEDFERFRALKTAMPGPTLAWGAVAGHCDVLAVPDILEGEIRCAFKVAGRR